MAQESQTLPKRIDKVFVPPIKCQGIKTKLVNFIALNIRWDGQGRWIEPFLGSGVVLFNVAPERAIASDTNEHIIKFYQRIQSGKIDGLIVKSYLEEHGAILSKKGEEYYYEVRDRFNKTHDSLDFLFLSRSCFNGMMRFNGGGHFNVPFCRKPDRFRQAYITKIVNQVNRLSQVIRDKDWVFQACDWREAIANAQEEDFLYLDPPYIGRHTDYYNQWTQEEAEELAKHVRNSPSGFALSMWLRNKYRENDHLEKCWANLVLRTFSHFYHVGSTEALRNEMEEALVIKPGFEAADHQIEQLSKRGEELELFARS